jgi:hypothetical protein
MLGARFVTAVFAESLAVAAAGSQAHASPITLTEKPGHRTEATVTIDASPSEIYRLVTDYARWPAVLSDVSAVRVEGGRDNAKVQFRSRTLDQQVTVQFDNVPDRVIRFRGIKGPPGGRAGGEYRLEPIQAPNQPVRTRVTATLYLDVVGVPAWFVSDSTIEAMRRRKLERDMTDVLRRFPAQ